MPNVTADVVKILFIDKLPELSTGRYKVMEDTQNNYRIGLVDWPSV